MYCTKDHRKGLTIQSKSSR